MRTSSASATTGCSPTTASRGTAPTSTACGSRAGGRCATVTSSRSAARSSPSCSPQGLGVRSHGDGARIARRAASHARAAARAARALPAVRCDDLRRPASNRQIADELVVSVDTVKGTLHELFETFGLTDLPQNQKRAALAQRALESGWSAAAISSAGRGSGHARSRRARRRSARRCRCGSRACRDSGERQPACPPGGSSAGRCA